MLEIFLQFVFCINPFGNHARRIEFVERERRGRREIFDLAGQIQIKNSACETIYQYDEKLRVPSSQTFSGQAVIEFSSISIAAPN